ncbi:hypothetical protein C8Q70DRAFT_930135 [Cubamyces menziesii]|nr:hypothetical protein C8Q70DRAFT_930135 [Cubamyces menziesii]
MPLNLNGYTAHISSDSEELEAYGIQHEDDKKSFVIHYSDGSASTNFSVGIYVDGRFVRRMAVRRGQRSGDCEGLLLDSESLDEVRWFKFAPLVLTVKPYTPPKVAEIGVVHEKSKKAGVHAVSFGEPVKAAGTRLYTTIGEEKAPFATFIFRYRPLELLRANGITPLPPRPEGRKKRSSDADAHNTSNDAGPSSNKRQRVDDAATQSVKPEPEEEDEDDDADEVTFLREQMVMLQQRLAEAEASQQARVRVKREVSPIRVPSSYSHEVIDLT